MKKRVGALFVLAWISTASLLAQAPIKVPNNRYKPEQDVELGREAAAEVRKEYPVINDQRITRYLAKLGDRLVANAPAELKQPVYEYSFTPVNLKEINAFALPGGPMFVHRGMEPEPNGTVDASIELAQESLMRRKAGRSTRGRSPGGSS